MLPKVLLLDLNYQPLSLIDWTKAFLMVANQRAEALEFYEFRLRSVSNTYAFPAVVRVFHNYRPRHLHPTKKNIFARDNYTCAFCGRRFPVPQLSVDHILPVFLGGKDTWENLVTACLTCNRKKDNRTPQQAGLPLLNRPVKPEWNPIFITHQEMNEQWERWLGKKSL